ncbi:MAG TPA: HK97 family phage prohead protease [Jatrophihabitantaceae bacterium]|jgi:HK97 family phage prohead protease
MTAVTGTCDSCGQGDLAIDYNDAGIPWTCAACTPKAAHVARRAASTEQTPLGPVSRNSLPAAERKIVHAAVKTAVLAESTTDFGTFEGIENATGLRDRQGDLTARGAFTRAVADLNSGRASWAITRQHSDDPADVVGFVTAAQETAEGLWVRASWTADPVAQQLRKAVSDGAKLGLSITYIPRGFTPDAAGRVLHDIDVISVAVTNSPANAASYIRSGKGALASAGPSPSSAPIVTVEQHIVQESARRDPDVARRVREDVMLAGLDWPPRDWPRDMRLAVVNGAAEAKSRRDVQSDPVRAAALARRDRDNDYSNALAATMTRLAAAKCEHPNCLPGSCVYR